MQDSVGRCKTGKEGAGLFKECLTVQDSARQCRTVSNSVSQCKIVQDRARQHRARSVQDCERINRAVSPNIDEVIGLKSFQD